MGQLISFMLKEMEVDKRNIYKIVNILKRQNKNIILLGVCTVTLTLLLRDMEKRLKKNEATIKELNENIEKLTDPTCGYAE